MATETMRRDFATTVPDSDGQSVGRGGVDVVDLCGFGWGVDVVDFWCCVCGAYIYIY